MDTSTSTVPTVMYRPRAIRGTLMDAQVNTGPLEPHVILWGGNDGGKNRVTRVLELALTAAVDDVMGRGTAGPKGDPVRLVADLADLANPDGSILATVDLERPGDEAMLCASWSLRTKGGTHSPTWDLPPALRLLKDRGNTEAAWWVMPTRTVYQWISSGPETARQHFLPYIVPAAEIREALDTSQEDGSTVGTLRERVLKLFPSAPLNMADDVLDVIQMLKGDVDALTTLVSSKQAVLDERKRSIRNPRVAPETLTALSVALDAAQHAQRNQSVVTAAGPMLQEYWSLAGTLPAQANHIENARMAALAYIAGSRPFVNPDASIQQASASGVLRALELGAQATLTIQQTHGTDLQWLWAGLQQTPRCACCGGVPNPAVLQYVANTAQGMIQPSQAALAAHAQWLELCGQWTNAQAQITQWSAMYQNNVTRHAALERDLRSLLNVPQGPLPATIQAEEVAGLAATLADLTSKVETARTTEALWTEVAAIEENLRNETERLTRIQNVLLDLSTMIEALLVRCVKDFEAAVSRYLPDGTEAAIRLSDDPSKGKVRRMFRLTFRRGGREESPCGGGMTALVLAVTAVVLDRFPGKINSTILTLPDDRGWSTDGLERYLAPLSRCPYPILVVCNVEPPAALGELGWQILHVNEVTRLGAVAGVAQTAPTPTKAPRKPRATRTTTVADAGVVTPITNVVPPITTPAQGVDPATAGGIGALAAALVDQLVFAQDAAGAPAAASNTAPTLPTTPPATSPVDDFRRGEEDKLLGTRGWSGSQIAYLRKKPDQLARALAADDIRPIAVGGQWLVTTAGQLQHVPVAPAPN